MSSSTVALTETWRATSRLGNPHVRSRVPRVAPNGELDRSDQCPADSRNHRQCQFSERPPNTFWLLLRIESRSTILGSPRRRRGTCRQLAAGASDGTLRHRRQHPPSQSPLQEQSQRLEFSTERSAGVGPLVAQVDAHFTALLAPDLLN
jgi:hypothetical protein